MSKHTKSLDTIGKLKDGEYYKYSVDKGFSIVDPSEIIYKTHSINNLYSYFETYIELKKQLENLNTSLLKSLEDKGIYVDNDELTNTIRKTIDTLDNLTMKVEGLDILVIDDENYVQSSFNIKGIITLDNIEKPLDVNIGCYKAILDNGKIKFILDKEKYERLWF